MTHNIDTRKSRFVLVAASLFFLGLVQPAASSHPLATRSQANFSRGVGWAAISAAQQLQKLAPPLKVETAQGEVFDLAAMRGKVVLVNFWATWCAPCLKEFPAIGDFHQKHHAEGFEVVALSIDTPRNRSKMMALLSKLPFPGALLSDAVENGFERPSAVPVSYLIDARGVIRDTFINIDEDLLNETVPPLLREARPAPTMELETR